MNDDTMEHGTPVKWAGTPRLCDRSWLDALTRTFGAALVVGIASYPSVGATQEQPQRGGILSVGVASEVSPGANLDPQVFGTGSIGADRGSAIFGTLLNRKPDGSMEPGLALSVTSVDGIHWRLILRRGLKFTDGTPLDAEAVIFNLRRQAEPGSPSQSASFARTIPDMKAASTTEVDITLSQPNGNFPILLSDLSNLGIIASPTAIAKDPRAFADHPIGAGPFMLKSWAVDSAMSLVKSPTYWNAENVMLDGITLRVIPDPQTRAAALESGQVDLVLALPTRIALNISGVKYYPPYQEGGLGYIWNTTSAMGKDARLRHALQRAIDPKQTAVALTGKPNAFTVDQVNCVPFLQSQCHTNVLPNYSADSARKMVREYLADGNPADIEYMTLSGFNTDSDQYILSVLSSIGLKPRLKIVSASEYFENLGKGNYTLSFVAYFGPYYPRGDAYLGPERQNWLQLPKDGAEAAIVRRVDYAAREDERAAAIKELQRFWTDNGAVIWVSPYPQLTAYSPKVRMSPLYQGLPIQLDWANAWLHR